MNPKISIIVPMYGVEKYLDKCVKSIQNQTIRDIEIILVDDGSPDKCGELAEEYAKEDSRIKVIHQENSGLGPARNSGMYAASGEYIGFVDSDDWVDVNMFSRLYQVAKKQKADIVVSGHCDWTEGKIVRTKRHPLAGKTVTEKSEIDEIRKNLYGRSMEDKETESFPMSVWIAIYKRNMIIDNYLKFKNIISEDVIFNISAYKCASCISFTENTDYCYRKENQASITQNFSNKKLKKYEEYLMTLLDVVSKENDPDCLMRVKRASINICRLYVGQVANTAVSLKEKKSFISSYANSKVIQECWNDYPVDTLPFQQKIFQKSMQSGHYGIALLLNDIRQILKKRFKR